MKESSDWIGDHLYLGTHEGVRIVFDTSAHEIIGLRDGEVVGVEFAKSCGTWTPINDLCAGDDFRGWTPFPRADHRRVKGLLEFLQGRDRLRIVAEAEGIDLADG